MKLRRLHLRNFLSFGPDTPPLDLQSLNVIIGPNGTGKSNIIEAISVLRFTTKGRPIPSQVGIRISDWIWRGNKGEEKSANIQADISFSDDDIMAKYEIAFTEFNGRFHFEREEITRIHDNNDVVIYSRSTPPHHFEMINDAYQDVGWVDEYFESSILSKFKGSTSRSEFDHINGFYSSFRIYREWRLGRNAPARMPQPTDATAEFLEEDGSNLGLILWRFRKNRIAYTSFLSNLKEIYSDILDFSVRVVSDTIQVVLNERGRGEIPATRLSDGTLRYLCLLAILLHPSPPPLVCIEEPELGLHPDVIVRLAALLKDASTRMQLIVTTHSDVLLDALSDTPESVLICESHNGSTVMQRLDREKLAPWLEEEGLGQLWRRGVLGGNRW